MQSEVEVDSGRKTESGVPAAIRAELEAKLALGTLELPLLPGVAMEVTSAAAKQEVDARVIADLLKRDPSMSAHVLRIVNSPVYSPRAQIVSLQQAVARVGVDKIREIALVIACRTGVFKAKGYEREIDQVFEHSVACALFAQEIARSTRSNVEDAFLCGLLHDVGRPVLLQALLRLLRDARLTADREAVLGLVSELHARAGSALAQSWKLPETVVSALAKHHTETPALEPVPVRIVSLADAFAHKSAEGELSCEKLAGHPALAALEIYPDMLEKLVHKAGVVKETLGVLS